MVELVEGLVSALYYKRTFPRTIVQDLCRQYRAQAWVPVVACHSDSAPPPPAGPSVCCGYPSPARPPVRPSVRVWVGRVHGYTLCTAGSPCTGRFLARTRVRA